MRFLLLGDAVCNTAIGLLKSAVKTTGEHKQKIFIRINYTGITLLDAFNQVKIESLFSSK